MPAAPRRADADAEPVHAIRVATGLRLSGPLANSIEFFASEGCAPRAGGNDAMLFLTRKVGESIVINDDIEVTVVEVRGRSIKLGFTFPPEAKVLRRELHDRIKAEAKPRLPMVRPRIREAGRLDRAAGCLTASAPARINRRGGCAPCARGAPAPRWRAWRSAGPRAGAG